jgi:hypothetical protein
MDIYLTNIINDSFSIYSLIKYHFP